MKLSCSPQDAESVRRKLIRLGALDREKRIMKKGGKVIFPVIGEPDIEGAELVEGDAPPKEPKPKSLAQALAEKLPPDIVAAAPTAYTLVGDIAIVEIADSVKEHASQIGEALLHLFPSIHVVAQKTGMVGGDFRVPELAILAGQDRTRTVHRENGCRFHLDLAESYFNPRTGTERARVAGLAGDGERALVMFAGVGPYAIQLARAGATVTAVELNPRACADMRENARINHVGVEVVEGDVRQMVPGLGEFDRIVMPLPKIAGMFLGTSLEALAPNGIIHYYLFAHDAAEAERLLLEKLPKKPSSMETLLTGAYSPCLSKYCIDFSMD